MTDLICSICQREYEHSMAQSLFCNTCWHDVLKNRIMADHENTRCGYPTAFESRVLELDKRVRKLEGR